MNDFSALRRQKPSRAYFLQTKNILQILMVNAITMVKHLGWWHSRAVTLSNTAAVWKRACPLSKDELRFTFQHDNNLSTSHRKPHYHWNLRIHLDRVPEDRWGWQGAAEDENELNVGTADRLLTLLWGDHTASDERAIIVITSCYGLWLHYGWFCSSLSCGIHFSY